MAEAGLQYGAGFRPIIALHRGDADQSNGVKNCGDQPNSSNDAPLANHTRTIASMRVPGSCGAVAAVASLVDGSMQLAAPLIPGHRGSLRVPACIAAYAYSTELGRALYDLRSSPCTFTALTLNP